MIDTNKLLSRLGYYVDEIIHGSYEIYIVSLVPENVIEEDVHQVLSSNTIYFPGDKQCEYSIYPDLINNPILDIKDQSIEASINFLSDWFGLMDEENTTKSKYRTIGRGNTKRITYISLDDMYMGQRFMGLYMDSEDDNNPWINNNISSNPYKSSLYHNYMKDIGDEILRSIKVIRKHELCKIV